MARPNLAHARRLVKLLRGCCFAVVTLLRRCCTLVVTLVRCRCGVLATIPRQRILSADTCASPSIIGFLRLVTVQVFLYWATRVSEDAWSLYITGIANFFFSAVLLAPILMRQIYLLMAGGTYYQAVEDIAYFNSCVLLDHKRLFEPEALSSS